MDNRTRPHMKTDTLHRILTFCALAGFSFSSPLSLAQSQPSAGHPSIPRLPIWPAGTISEVGADTLGDPSVPTVDVHLPAPEKANGTAVVVLPGGGYGGLSMDFEGEHSARFLTDNGIAAFVVRYRHAPRFIHPVPLQDALQAVRWVRSRAAEFHIAPNRVGLMGFSAGGHLASTVITHIDRGNPDALEPFGKMSARPDFAILFYPVITFTEEAFVHGGSRKNLTADKQDLWLELSNERKVSKDTPPVFLIHGGKDKGVPPENSMMFAEACRKAGVSVELHILSQGEHAFRDEPIRAEAYEDLRHWLGRNGWLTNQAPPP